MDDKQFQSLDVTSIDDHIQNKVDWKNPPTVKDLRNDLAEAMSSHSNHVSKVDEYLKTLRGEINIVAHEGRSKVQPKLVRKQNEWRYSALEEPFLSTNDMFIVNPVTYQDVDSAKQNISKFPISSKNLSFERRFWYWN